MLREAKCNDLDALLELYLYLHEDHIPLQDAHLSGIWHKILEDPYRHLVVNEINGRILSSCDLIIVPNLTRNVRPYAFIENVVTHPDFRNHGYAGQCIDYAISLAGKENCYKVMLLTGSKEEATLHFYESHGFNQRDKTAFIRWL